MALVQKRDAKKNIMSFVLLGVVVVGGIVALVMYLPKNSSNTNTGGSFASNGRDLQTFTNFDEDIYSSDQFRQLNNYLNGAPVTNTNVNAGGGNTNPFRQQ